ncbi:MAG: polyprenyl synthetase family protein [Thaumarchaeota archaeon]|nr:polyprenyl synthetase family protein [Nitrososphaerota archaeon]
MDTALSDLNVRIASYAQKVDRYIDRQSMIYPFLQNATKRALQGGKRIRPILSLLSCEAVLGDAEPALPIAIAYELAHSSSLIQDDIVDSSDRRRGMPTIYSQFGLGPALLTSDMLIFDIFLQVVEYKKSKLDGNRLYALLSLLGESAKATAIGEYLDQTLSLTTARLEQYIQMVKLKTGCLLGGAAASGAVVGGASENLSKALQRFGEGFGTAYQIRDDYLDVMGDASILGKPILTDLRNSSKNILVIHALSNTSSKRRDFLLGIIGRRMYTDSDVSEVRRIVTEAGSVDYASELAASTAVQTRGQLTGLPESNAKGILESLTYMAVNRVS